METTSSPSLRHLYSPGLPLAVYREVAAHLCQVPGIEVQLLPPTTTAFDYYQSQIGSIQIQYAEKITTGDRARVDQILQYYGDRYRPWQTLETPDTSA